MKSLDSYAKIVEELNPDRIYVENVRSLLKVPARIAQFICNLAVKSGDFRKRYGVVCPNDSCQRIVLSVNNVKDIPDTIECESCDAEGNEHFSFNKNQVQVLEYYQLVSE